jgi:hypothetical protein
VTNEVSHRGRRHSGKGGEQHQALVYARAVTVPQRGADKYAELNGEKEQGNRR